MSSVFNKLAEMKAASHANYYLLSYPISMHWAYVSNQIMHSFDNNMKKTVKMI